MATKAVRPKRVKIPVRGPGKTPITLIVNGQAHELLVEPRRTLLDALRKDLGLTGAKKACDEGTCGACTVLLDSKPIYACMALAIECEGRAIEDDRGLGSRWEAPPHPASVHRRRCAAVRLLYPRADYGRQGPARCKPKPNARGREARSVGKPLPLRGIPKDFQGGPARGRIVGITESTA
jgi:hypothetical protein